jgi:hypothetical protein
VDPVPTVLRALAFGLALGIGCQALVTWTVRTLQLGAPATATPALDSPAALVLLLGTLAGILTAGFGAWVLLRPIRNPWRQAMLAMIAGLGSFALSLVTIPVDRRLGRPGLLVLAVLAVGLAFLLARRRAPAPS